MKKSNALTQLLIAFCVVQSYAQTVTVRPDESSHIFEGAGTSIGLYIDHHFSMSEENQDEAIRMINKDINMQYLQDYNKFYPEDRPDYYDRRADYFKAAKAYRPESKVTIVFNNFPARLRIDSLEDTGIDVSRETIYDEIADWYFKSLVAYKERDVDVDIINLFNEPDFEKDYLYGYDDAKEGTAQILINSVPKFLEMINDAELNTMEVKQPEIMAPSTLGTGASRNFSEYYRDNHDGAAWELIDIISTHQYSSGINRDNFADIINMKREDQRFFQSEQHAFHSDNLGLKSVFNDTIPEEKALMACIDFAALFSTAVNGGVEAWYYFENNVPSEQLAGVIRVPWGGSPSLHKWYYPFKQLTSTQPQNSSVLINEVSSDINTREVVSFRYQEEDTVYLNISNFEGGVRTFNVNLLNAEDEPYKIRSYSIITTDSVYSSEQTDFIQYTEDISSFEVDILPYSVNTIKVCFFEDMGLEYQTLSFEIEELEQGITQVPLSASLTSGLAPVYELIEGSGTIANNTLAVNEPGVFTIKSFHPGNESFYPSNFEVVSFCVNPDPTINITNGQLVSSIAGDSSLWFSGILSQGDYSTDSVFTPIISGNYSVQVALGGCLGVSDPVFIDTDQLTTGLSTEANLKVWMTNGVLNILDEEDVFHLSKVEIFNLNGKKIVDYNCNNCEDLEFEVKGLGTGLYVVRLWNSRGQTSSHKVFKN